MKTIPTAKRVFGAQTPFGGSSGRGGLGAAAKALDRMWRAVRGLNFDKLEGRRHCLEGRGGIMRQEEGMMCYCTNMNEPTSKET